MIYICVVWLVYSCFWFYMLNYSVKNSPEFVEELGDKEAVDVYLKYHLIFNFISAILAPVVHLWQIFYWVMKKVVFGIIDLISNVFKVEKGKK